MTRMLVVIRSAPEALTAIAGGADRLVLEATDVSVAAEVGAAAGGRCPVSLWPRLGTGDLGSLRAACGADELYGAPAVLAGAAVGAIRFAVLSPADAPDLWERDAPVLDGCVGLVLDVGQGGPRLLEIVAPVSLARSVAAARARGLAVAFAGRMEPPDVPRLLALAPDAILLDAVVRQDGRDGAPLDPARLRLLRDLMSDGRAPLEDVQPLGSDRITVRDWTVMVPIGAYSHEGTQRVSFTVVAELAPIASRAADLRDVVSYDLVTDAIARLTATHVALVETLAEDVAAAVLSHPRVLAVDVAVEKLDLGPGRVGCRIRRGRRPDA